MNQILPKWLVNALGGLLIAFVALLVVQKSNEISATLKNQKPANTISVSADGKVTATPDLATISIGVYSAGSDATTLKDQNNAKVNKVIDFVKGQGIADKDITTSQYNLSPQYDYTKGMPVINGYQVNQTVTVKIHGVDKDASVLNKIVEGAVNNGANEVNSNNLSFENPDALQQQARKLAIDNAKKKAQDLAAEAGLTLGKVVSVSETSNYFPGPIAYGGALAMDAGVNMAKSVAPSFQTGSQDVTESMTVVYEVK